MNVSLLERIYKRPVRTTERESEPVHRGEHRIQAYQRVPHLGQFHPLLLCKLVRNYRSHPDIIAVPSRLFYE